MDVLDKAMATYCLLMTSTGTIANILGAVVCMREKLRNIPTFRLFTVMFIFDILALYPLSLNYSLSIWFGIDLFNTSINLSRWGTFIQFFGGNVSSWILVIISFERYVAVKVTLWRKIYFNAKKATYLAVVVIICALVINSPLFIFEVSLERGNFTLSPFAAFITTPSIAIIYQMSAYVNVIIPILLLTIANILLITEVTCLKSKIERSDRDNSKRRMLTISVVVATTFFIILNFPGCIVAGYFLTQISALPYGYIIIFAVLLLNITNFGTNFYILLFSNRSFRNEVRILFYLIKCLILKQKFDETNSKYLSDWKKDTTGHGL